MKGPLILSALLVIGMLVIQSCAGFPHIEKGKMERVYQRQLQLEQAIGFLGAPFRTGGFPANENCMKGNYYHVYETDSGYNGHEVWLCCVPVEELLRESFSCADNVLINPALSYIGDPDYLKVRYCYLYDALSTEVVMMPVCIPAPLEAPGIDIK